MLLSSIVIVGVVLTVGLKIVNKAKKRDKNISPSNSQQSLNRVQISPRVWQKVKNAVPFSSDLRDQHKEVIAPETIETSEIEKKAKFRLKISFINLGLTTFASIAYYPLLIATAPLYLYTVLTTYRDALISIIKERRAKPSLLSALAATGFIIGGMFFTAALSLLLASISRYFIIKTEDHSKKNISSLFGQQSSSIWIVKDKNEIQIPLDQAQINDIAVVAAGEMIPVDGIVFKGIASIDQHKLTGEAQPVEKTKNDDVFASTVVHSGKLYIQIKKTGKETVAAQIGQILNQTTDFKKVIKSRADIQSSKMIIPMLTMSALALPIGGINSATALFMNVPAYKMRYFGPLSMLNYLNIAARQNILIKDGRSIELLREIDTVVFDKTGTLTLEQPQVHHIYSFNGLSSEELLILAAAAEVRQTHPIARAILAEADFCKLNLPSIEEIRYEVGYGIKVNIDDQVVKVGSTRFMVMENILIPDHIRQLQSFCHQEGHSLIMIAIGNKLAGAIELRPSIRPEAASIIRQMQECQLELVIISGDHEGPTRQLAQKLGINRYFSQVLPKDKANLVEQLQQEGHSVCFVGDGINDAIALKKANVSISLRGATTIATDTAQIVLMDGQLNKLPELFKMAQEFEKNLKMNMSISTVPAFVCIGGVFLFEWSALTTVIITQSVFVSGMLNSARPLLKHVSQEKK